MITVKRFTAPWCAPCKMLAPVITGLANEYPEVKFEVIDVDENPQLASEHEIRTVPTVMFFKNDVMVDMIVGANAKQKYADVIKKLTEV